MFNSNHIGGIDKSIGVMLLGCRCVLFIHHLLRLDEACIGQVYLVDGALVERHIPIVPALKRNQIPRLDDVRLAKVFEFDVLVLKVEMAQLTLTCAVLASIGAG